MKYTLIFLSLFIVGCSQSNQKTNEKPIDTSRYSVFKYDVARDSTLFGKGDKPADLSSVEIDTIENIIAKKVAEYNVKAKPYRDSLEKQLNFVSNNIVIEHPEKYYKQLIAVKNSKGEKIVWVNCLCAAGKSNKEIIRVADGGSCFFQIEINLTKSTIIGFWVNGLG